MADRSLCTRAKYLPARRSVSSAALLDESTLLTPTVPPDPIPDLIKVTGIEVNSLKQWAIALCLRGRNPTMASSNRRIDEARRYHEVTRHSFTSVRTDGHVLDWDNRPFPFKIYPHAAALSLPRDLQLPSTPTLETISETTAAHPDTPLDLERLTRILFSAAGLTRKRRVGMEDYHFRAAASAGA